MGVSPSQYGLAVGRTEVGGICSSAKLHGIFAMLSQKCILLSQLEGLEVSRVIISAYFVEQFVYSVESIVVVAQITPLERLGHWL
jgi:hypothetical protein